MTQVAEARLKSFIERIERLEESKQEFVDDIKLVLQEAKGEGYDVKAIKTLIKIRKKDRQERLEEEAILETYKSALGID